MEILGQVVLMLFVIHRITEVPICGVLWAVEGGGDDCVKCGEWKIMLLREKCA